MRTRYLVEVWHGNVSLGELPIYGISNLILAMLCFEGDGYSLTIMF